MLYVKIVQPVNNDITFMSFVAVVIGALMVKPGIKASKMLKFNVQFLLAVD